MLSGPKGFLIVEVTGGMMLSGPKGFLIVEVTGG
jgi:hypothetical protein